MLLKEGTKIEPDFKAVCLFQIVGRCIAGCLQTVGTLFAVRDPYLEQAIDSTLFSFNFRGLEENEQPKNGRTDGQTLV